MNIKSNLYRAVGRSMVGRYSVYAVNVLSMMILARIFSPEVYGAVAAVAVFYVFFQMLSEAGLGPAIINLERLSGIDRDGLFGLTIFFGGIFSISLLAVSSWLLYFYEIPRVDEVARYVSISVFFFSCSVLPNALLLREQAFFRIANSGFIAEVVSTLATLALSHYIDALHALALKGVFSSAVVFLSVWYYSAGTEFGRPIPGVRFSAIKPLLAFSGYQLGFNFLNYFSRNLDNILIGKYIGASALGGYDKAYQLMRYPLLLLTFSMTPAIQPAIREHAGDSVKVEEIHRKFVYRLSLLGSIAGLAMYILAEPIVYLSLGEQWGSVVPIIKILAVAVPVQVVLSTSGSFFQAMQRADLLFRTGALGASIMVSAIVFGVLHKDIALICWGLVFAFHINLIQTYICLYKKVFLKPVCKFFFTLLPAGLIVLGMAIHCALDGFF